MPVFPIQFPVLVINLCFLPVSSRSLRGGRSAANRLKHLLTFPLEQGSAEPLGHESLSEWIMRQPPRPSRRHHTRLVTRRGQGMLGATRLCGIMVICSMLASALKSGGALLSQRGWRWCSGGIRGQLVKEGRGTAGQANRLESAARHDEERQNKQAAKRAPGPWTLTGSFFFLSRSSYPTSCRAAAL